MNFIEYLEKRKYRPRTVQHYHNLAEDYLQWVENQGLLIAHVRYADLMGYIRYCQKRGDSKKRCNERLCAIRHYYRYLHVEKQARNNPALNIHIRGIRRRIPHGLLDKDTLELIYQEYLIVDQKTLRNKVILGLLIFQAVRTEELCLMKPTHVHLDKGEVFIPSTPRSNARRLALTALQYPALQRYLRGKNRMQSQLFYSDKGSEKLQGTVYYLMEELRNRYLQVKHARQLRASRITEWLRYYNLREVQHMAGHRFVSSTERYQSHRLEDLQSQLKKYHPLRQPPLQ